MRLAESHLHNASREKRPQKYMGFALQPGDEELLIRLPVHHQQILRADGSYKDIATSLGVALGTVRSRLNRARAALTKLRQDASAQHEETPSRNADIVN